MKLLLRLKDFLFQRYESGTSKRCYCVHNIIIIYNICYCVHNIIIIYHICFCVHHWCERTLSLKRLTKGGKFLSDKWRRDDEDESTDGLYRRFPHIPEIRHARRSQSAVMWRRWKIHKRWIECVSGVISSSIISSLKTSRSVIKMHYNWRCYDNSSLLDYKRFLEQVFLISGIVIHKDNIP